MKKALAAVSIILFFITYSAGLTIYGAYGLRNESHYEEHREELAGIRSELEQKRRELEDRRELLDKPYMIAALAQRYGYILPGNTLVIYPEDAAEIAESRRTAEVLPSIDSELEQVDSSLLLLISLGVSLLFFLLGLLAARLSRK